MGRNTKISWCHHTHNAWWGCHKISPGCENCYAQAFDHRIGGDHWKLKGPRRFFGDKHWDEPLAWDRSAARRGVRERVFVNSFADWAEDRPDLIPHRIRLWRLIARCRNLDFLLLTKRPENAPKFVPWVNPDACPRPLCRDCADMSEHGHCHVDGTPCDPREPWPNVWLGTTVENRDYEWRADRILKVPAILHFLSLEPLLEEVDISPFLGPDRVRWVIAGAESGHRARDCHINSLRKAQRQCADASVDFFLKQAVEHTLDGTIVNGEVVWPITIGKGSFKKGRGFGGDIVELPYLDGVQYANVPEPRRAA